MAALWRSPEDHVCIPDIETRSCNIEVALETLKMFEMREPWAICLGMLLTEWNQPRRKQFVAINKDEKGVGDLKTSNMEMQSLEFSQLVF